jgi:hypothetical protein
MKLHKEEPTPFVKGSWTVVVLPDTQNYLDGRKPHVAALNRMMDWVVESKDDRNIKMVVHVGDMTNNDNDAQWKLIRAAYRKLDHKLPYVVCEGNHDRKHGNLMNDYFRLEDNPLNEKMFGGSREEGRLENSCYVTEINKMKYLFVAIGENPAHRAMNTAWASEVIGRHPDHRVFITHHVFLTEESRLLSKDGRPALPRSFSTLVKPHRNVEFLTCGHEGPRIMKDGKPSKLKRGKHTELATAHRSDEKPGLRFHSVLMNAQFARGGGQGWMLLMEFSADNKRVIVKTFSPYLNEWRTGKEYEYTLERD